MYAGSALSLDDSTISVSEEATSIAANTPYLVKGTVGTYTFSGVATNTQNTYSDGLLVGTLVDMTYSDFTPDSGQYVLQNHTEDEGYSEESEAGYGLAFYPITSASTDVTLDAYHCYLTTNANFLALHLPDMTTAIEAVESDIIAGDAIYDQSGRKVSKAVKGVYIQNGKKVLVR